MDITKPLDVIIDDELIWKAHISSVTKATTYHLYLLRWLKLLVVLPSKLMYIYKIHILPKLTYASAAWSSSLTAIQRECLEIVQKSACRTILGTYGTSYRERLAMVVLPSLCGHYHKTLESFGQELLTVQLNNHKQNKHNTRLNQPREQAGFHSGYSTTDHITSSTSLSKNQPSTIGDFLWLS